MRRPDPIVVHSVFDEHDFGVLRSKFTDVEQYEYQQGFGRYIASESRIPELSYFANKLIPLAKILFNSESLMPTYSLFSHYEGEGASLYKHKDDNACTYTLDLCLYQNEPWDLYVEGTSYTLMPNQALAYYGNDQVHWRESFTDAKNNKVAMIFFHFAEPDHWWFTKGPSYLDVIRNNMMEEQWEQRR